MHSVVATDSQGHTVVIFVCNECMHGYVGLCQILLWTGFVVKYIDLLDV